MRAGAEDPARQEKEGFDEREDSANDTAQQPKWKADDPDDGKQDDGQHCYRPAQHKQDAPEQESNRESHGINGSR